ncbi:MAG TPA: glycoside hydrolase family 13 protein [Ideonella sp.]|uniref:glycoside hydrolase family 13 protein n=1 Tax=Ideonella sp. TaxID=1929293 RepID=UPI002E306AD6|nr:glycoside hydrolase family 13 protein [Ideonella sp.]HEX5683796.1 glycoside hydrolase family 13 protein [Ideonella sp.]
MKLLPLALALLAGASAHAQSIDRVEPPFWWVGMKHRPLQLMLHGQQLSGLTAQISAPGVSVRRTVALPNPNYLVVELDVAANAKPGPVTLLLKRGQATVLRQPYELRARAPGSAQRQGFGPADAIYLVVPDRFANGDPTNDTVDALGDPVNRADPGGRHGGDLHGIAQHLDYIAGLGFTQLWPTPIVENKQAKYSYHGYSATDLYKVDPRFGSNEDYRRLAEQARAKGIGLIMDLVPNHIGSGHWWLTPRPALPKAGSPPLGGETPDASGATLQDLPTPDWLNHPAPYVETNHRHVTVQDTYAAAADRAGLTDGWFVPTMPDLNQRQPLLATYLVQNAIWWIEYAGLSGIRADTYPYSDKAFLARWSGAIMAEYPKLSIVGEEMTDHASMVAYWLRGHRNHDGYVSHMPSMMDFPLHGALRQALIEPEGQGYGTGFGRLYEALVEDIQYPEPSNLVLFEGNHDTNRVFSALGEDRALNKLALTYIATIARTPQLFYGSEILMKSPIERSDGVVRSDFPGGWHGDTADAFTGRGLSEAQREAQAFVKRLFNWRKHSVAVQRGRLVHYAPDRGTYTYFRHDVQTDATVMVVLSKATDEVRLDTRRFAELLPANAKGLELFSGAVLDLSVELVVPPRSAMVIDLAR